MGDSGNRVNVKDVHAGRDVHIQQIIADQYSVYQADGQKLESLNDVATGQGPPPVIIRRCFEAEQLHRYYNAVLDDRRGRVSRLLLLSGDRATGKRDLLRQFQAEIADNERRPRIITTTYQSAALSTEIQRAYYQNHPALKEAWATYAEQVESHFPSHYALGGEAWIALAVQLLQRSPAARAYIQSLAAQTPDSVSNTEDAMRARASDLLEHAQYDGPLILVLEQIQYSDASLHWLLDQWLNELGDLPILLILTIDYPYPIEDEAPEQKSHPWLEWLRTQTASSHNVTNQHPPQSIHLDQLTVADVEALLAEEYAEAAWNLHYMAGSSPVIVRTLLHQWALRHQAECQKDGRWSIDVDSMENLPTKFSTRHIDEVLQPCVDHGQALGYEVDLHMLRSWLGFAIYEGDTFTDEALAYAVDMHGEELDTFQEALDEVLVWSEENPAGVLDELEGTVDIPTAELERTTRYMVRYRFRHPILVTCLRQAASSKQSTWLQQGQKYLQALEDVYSPHLEWIASTLIQIAIDLGLLAQADDYRNLTAPAQDRERSNILITALRTFTDTPFGQSQFARYVLGYFETNFRRVNARSMLPPLKEAVHWAQVIDNRVQQAKAYHYSGLTYSDLGENQKALEQYEQALPLRRAVGDRRGEASTLTSMGQVYSSLGENQKALEQYEQALPLRRAVGDRRGEASTLTSMGQVYSSLGENQKALEYYEQALPLRRAVGDRRGEASTLTSMGQVYSSLGEKQKALGYSEKAVALAQEIGMRWKECEYAASLADIYVSLNFINQAIETISHAAELAEELGHPKAETYRQRLEEIQRLGDEKDSD